MTKPIPSQDQIDVQARLEEFRQLKNGWLDGKGLAPSDEGLNWLASRFQSLYPQGLPAPYLSPTAEGGVQAEWSLDDHEVSLEISLDSHQAEWHDLNVTTEEASDRVLDLNDRQCWEWLAERIAEMQNQARQELHEGLG